MFVIARDWSLRGAVRAELRERGMEALGLEDAEEAAKAVAAGTLPDAIILDSAVARTPAASQLGRRFPVVLVASRTEPVPEIGAVGVLWRPVQVNEIVEHVTQLLKGRAA